MKKVNFVFNMIEQFQCILIDLSSESDTLRKALINLWAEDTNGEKYILPENIVCEVFEKINESMDWMQINMAARETYPTDFDGNIDFIDNEQAFVDERINWFNSQIIEQVSSSLDDKQAHLLIKALRDLFDYLSLERYYPEGRDYSYCNYFLNYNDTIRILHNRIIELASNIA